MLASTYRRLLAAATSVPLDDPARTGACRRQVLLTCPGRDAFAGWHAPAGRTPPARDGSRIGWWPAGAC